MRYMANLEQTDWVVRIQVTEAQRKALKQLAVERDQELRWLFTDALSTSPITKRVFA